MSPTGPDWHVDSYRFFDGPTTRALKGWAALPAPADVPWTPLTKPLTASRVALISSAGVALKTDPPFDQDVERNDPWTADPSWRRIPRTATAADIEVFHLHINPAFARSDLGCVLPLRALDELEASGEIASSAPSHYSYLGYTLRPQRLLEESVPAIVASLEAEEVDVVVLVPS